VGTDKRKIKNLGKATWCDVKSPENTTTKFPPSVNTKAWQRYSKKPLKKDHEKGGTCPSRASSKQTKVGKKISDWGVDWKSRGKEIWNRSGVYDNWNGLQRRGRRGSEVSEKTPLKGSAIKPRGGGRK